GGQPALLAQLLADDLAGLLRHRPQRRQDRAAVLGRRPIWHLPMKGNRRLARQVALDGVREVTGPARPPILAVAEDLQPDRSLQLERRQDRAVLDLPQFVGRDPRLGLSGMRLQHLRRAQQTANMVRPIYLHSCGLPVQRSSLCLLGPREIRCLRPDEIEAHQVQVFAPKTWSTPVSTWRSNLGHWQAPNGYDALRH